MQMLADMGLLEAMVKEPQAGFGDCVLYVNGASTEDAKTIAYPMRSVSLERSPTPVNKPTTRGGTYFTDKFVYRMTGIVEDLSIIPLLTKEMLGPNTDFGELRVTGTAVIGGLDQNVEMFVNITDSFQTPSYATLGMMVVRATTPD